MPDWYAAKRDNDPNVRGHMSKEMQWGWRVNSRGKEIKLLFLYLE